MINIQLKPYYVYELIDPFNNEVFYVGKGTSDRLLKHNSLENTEKGKRIKNIESKGGQHIKLVIGRYDTEQEAIAVEATLIKWIYSIHNLTNKINGHHHFFIRDCSEKQKASYTKIQGLDVPRKISGIKDGSYTNELLTKIQNNSIYEKLLGIKEELRTYPFFENLNISDPNFTDPSNPIISITGFSQSIKLQIKMHLTGKSIILTLTPLSKDTKTLNKYINDLAILNPPIIPKNIRTAKMYAHVTPHRKTNSKNLDRIECTDYDTLKKRIISVINEILTKKINSI